MPDPVAVAVITGAFGVIVALLERARLENRRDHGEVGTKLDHLADGQRRVEGKLDRHINDHAKGEV